MDTALLQKSKQAANITFLEIWYHAGGFGFFFFQIHTTSDLPH